MLKDRQEARYVTDANGHEVYEGEDIYWWDGKWLCQECMEDEIFRKLPLQELVLLAGGDVETVGDADV